MKQKIEETVNNVFYNIQFNKTSHQKYMKKLTNIYNQHDVETFWEAFISCLRIPLTMAQRHPRIENTLDFAARFAVSFYSFSDIETKEPMCPFLTKLFSFLLSYHNAKDLSARFRICHFLNKLLNSMGEHAFIDDALCDKITICMMERLLDKSAKVRAQAVLALHRLQDPCDDHCPVIKMYIFHLCKDPKPEVRRAVLASMGKNQKTLQAVLRRTRDVDDNVRKMAFEFISKVTVRSLTIQQRDQLLNDGLKDRSEIVRKAVENVMLPSWLRHFNGEYISLLKALDVEIGTDASTLALTTLFRSAALNSLLEQLPLDQNTKLISIDKLSTENVLYWKCLVKHVHSSSYTEEMEMILPELSNFCAYIQSFLTMMSSKKFEAWEIATQKFILLQLLEIVTTYDLSDEVGRNNLRELILHIITTDHCSEKITHCIVKHLEHVIPDVNARLDALANVISELRLPSKEPGDTQVPVEQQHEINMKRAKLKVNLLELQEEEYQAIQEKNYLKAAELKDKISSLHDDINKLSDNFEMIINDDMAEEKSDSETMIKCLNIMCAMMPVKSITTLTPTLRSLMHIALDSLDHPDDNVHILALKVVGICCILDKELAKKHIMMFFLQFSLEQENQEIWIIALKAIFDLLLLYGLEYFEILQNIEENLSQNQSTRSHTVRLYSEAEDNSLASSSRRSEQEEVNFIKILTGLLDNANQELRTVATEGLCKLLLNQRVNSSSLLSRLIILCYNPATETDVYLRQCLSSFFDSFVTHVPNYQEMLEGAFFPTLRVLSNAPDISPLQEIDPYDVSKFILSLTRSGGQKSNSGIYSVHNNLAFAILAEVLNPQSKIDQETLIKSLKNLDVQIDDDTSKENLTEAIDKVSKMVMESDKELMKYVQQFKRRLQNPIPIETITQEDTENED